MWGTTKFDEYLGGHRGVLKDSVIKEILDEAKKNQVELFDTAEGYGDGTSEDRLGRLISLNEQQNFIIASKYLPMFWRMTQQQFDEALESSRKRLNVKTIDLYLLHTPIHWLGLEFHVKCLARAKQDGRVRCIGISNDHQGGHFTQHSSSWSTILHLQRPSKYLESLIWFWQHVWINFHRTIGVPQGKH